MSDESNTQMPLGILFSRRELAHLDAALERLAADYQDADQPDMPQEVHTLRKRVQECNSVPKGMPDERHEYHFQHVATAMRDRGVAGDAFVKAVQQYWAELLRTETKPAEALAQAFAQIAQATAQGNMVGVIQVLGAKLSRVEKRHPEGAALADELGQWLVSGEQSLSRGEQPWPEDTDLRRQPAPNDT